jgi:NodT family efflux transporter outer membrane factor (OMF) lipoprotein
MVRAEAQLATFDAEVPPLEVTLAQNIHRLGVLTGQPPEALVDLLSQPQPIPVSDVLPGTSVPAALLRRRPDVRNAERLLAEATANIGVAVADLYPSVTLPGSISFSSTKLADLFTAGSLLWSIGPQVTFPLFDAGLRRAEVDARIARQAQARADWERTVLQSLEEVENALVAYTREGRRRELLRQSVASNADAVALATELYTRGLGTFLDVLDAQRSLFTAQNDLAASEAALSADLIALYKALGGGWAVGISDSPALAGRP